MKIFIASSRESAGLMHDIEMWLQEDNHDPLTWDTPGLFPPGEQTFLTLIDISKQIDGAICIFGEDDKVWYRGDAAAQPRDNVLIEYGLFVGALGPRRAIICRHGTPRHATDLQGISFIDLNPNRIARGRREVNIWSNRMNTSYIDPAILNYKIRNDELKRDNESLMRKIDFETGRSKDLEKLLLKAKVLDFENFDLEKDGHWKLLFNSDYFEGGVEILAQNCDAPIDMQSLLNSSGSTKIATRIAWEIGEANPQRNIKMARKVLRVFRRYYESEQFLQFINDVPTHIRNEFNKLAKSCLAKLKIAKKFENEEDQEEFGENIGTIWNRTV